MRKNGVNGEDTKEEKRLVIRRNA